MSIYDYGTVLFYFVFIAAVGFVYRKLNKTSTDYFAGSFRITWWLLGTSMFVSNISAWAFTGAAHIAYSFGTVIFAITLADILGYMLAFLWFGSRLRQLRVVTAMQAVGRRFRGSTEQVYTWLTIVGGMVTATVWMVGLSIILSSVFRIPQIATILLSGASVTILSLFGGRWAVVASDFIQLILLLTISLAVFFLSAHRLGGMAEYFHAIPDHLRNPILDGSSPYDKYWIIGFVLLSLIARNNLSTAYRFISAKDSRHARFASLIPILGYLILPICWFTVPMIAQSISPNLEQTYSMFKIPSEASYIAVAILVLPHGLLGLLVAGILASTMSSIDNALNRNAGYFVKSVYEPILRRHQASEDELMRAGKITTVVLAFLVVMFSVLIVQGGEISLFDMYQQLNGRLTVPLAVPVFWGMFVRKIPKWGAWVTILFGLVVSLIIFDGMDTVLGQQILQQIFGSEQANYILSHPVTWSFLVNIPLTSLFFLSTRFFVKREQEEHEKEVNRFFRDFHKPVEFEKEVGQDNSSFQAASVGTLAIIYGASVSVLLVIPNPIEGRVAIAGISAFLLSVGAALVFYARRRGKSQHSE